MNSSLCSFDPVLAPVLLQAWEQSDLLVALFDAEDRLRYANAAFDALFLRGLALPVTFADMYRHSFRLGIGSNIDCGDIEAFLADVLPRRRCQALRRVTTDTTDGRWLQFTEQLLDGGWLLTVACDISALKLQERTLAHARAQAERDALSDALTGLPNRRHITELARRALTLQAGMGTSLAVALIDLDHFKRINDAYGHSAGDAVLVGFARLAESQLRVSDACGRWGGEEFLVLLPGADLDAALEVIERLRIQYAQSQPYASSLSAGVAQAHPGESLDALFARADEALYRAKKAGRNQTQAAAAQSMPRSPLP